jgi:hypothetical protein
VEIRLIPEDWPLAPPLLALAGTVVERLDLEELLGRLELIPDAMTADDRSWLRLDRAHDPAALTLWFHPDQILRDRPGHGAARPEVRSWELLPPPRQEPEIDVAEFSPPNAQRFLYQQLLLVRDVLTGRLHPEKIPSSLVEAFQEAWLVTVDGRLHREALPHLSAAERRLRFLRLFSPAGVLTPGHWAIFNDLWEGRVAEEAEVLAKVRLLPPLRRRRQI